MLMDPMTAYNNGASLGGLNNNDGYLGKLRTDLIEVPWIENTYLHTVDIYSNSISAVHVKIEDAEIESQETNRFTATRANVTHLTADNIMVGDRTLKQYILDIINDL